MTSHEQMIEDCCEAEEKVGLDELEAFADQQRDFDAALKTWLAAVQTRIDAHHERNFPNQRRAVMIATKGPKFFRIVRNEGEFSRSAYAFVERATGNIYKPAGWKGPEKNFPRGNIYQENKLSWCGVYGIENAR